MRHFYFIRICQISCILLFTVLAGKSVYARELSTILESKEIRFCLAGSSQEFYKSNAQAFANYLDALFPDIKVQATHISFEEWNDQFVNDNDEVLRDLSYTPKPLKSGECDLYPNDLIKIDWRESKLAYVDLFYSRNIILIHKSDSGKYRSVSDLAGKTAAVMEGTAFHEWIEKQNETTLKDNPVDMVFLPQKEAITAVSDNKYDFAITGADGAYWAIHNFAPNAVVAFPTGESRTIYGWAFRKQDKDLQKTVEMFFADQTSQLNSELNLNWKHYYGISLSEFSLFLSTTY